MADRLTQLQDTINLQADHFCNSIGILQQFSVPSKFPGFDRVGPPQSNPPQDQDYASLFASIITRCAKDIDTLIDSLPSEESSQETQVASLHCLEEENQLAFQQLEQVVRQGETLLGKIQAALQDIAQSQLDIQNPIGDTISNPQLNFPTNIKEDPASLEEDLNISSNQIDISSDSEMMQ